MISHLLAVDVSGTLTTKRFRVMTDQLSRDNESNPDLAAKERPDEEEKTPIPDESTLMGRNGVEDEVLAELARAEGIMSDPSAPDDPDARGAQV